MAGYIERGCMECQAIIDRVLAGGDGGRPVRASRGNYSLYDVFSAATGIECAGAAAFRAACKRHHPALLRGCFERSAFGPGVPERDVARLISYARAAQSCPRARALDSYKDYAPSCADADDDLGCGHDADAPEEDCAVVRDASGRAITRIRRSDRFADALALTRYANKAWQTFLRARGTPAELTTRDRTGRVWVHGDVAGDLADWCAPATARAVRAACRAAADDFDAALLDSRATEDAWAEIRAAGSASPGGPGEGTSWEDVLRADTNSVAAAALADDAWAAVAAARRSALAADIRAAAAARAATDARVAALSGGAH